MADISDNLATMGLERHSISGRARWLGLTAAASGMFLTSLDITVNVALPDITESFGTDAVTIQWIIIFYVGGSTAMQLGLGGAADALGLKRMFIAGLAAYTVAVTAIGFADSLALVFGLRVFQAVGNGLLIALAPALATRLFPPDFRGRALGIMAALGTLGMITGSLGGGVLVDAFGWRAIFLARAPLCIAAIVFSMAFLRVPGDSGRGGGFDLRGALAQLVAIGALILLLSLGGRNGWTEPYVPALGVVSICGFWSFALFERRAKRPLLDVSMLRNRTLTLALAASMLAFIATFVNWFVLPFFVVDALGASASVWGALLLTMTLATALASPLGGWLSDLARPAYTMTAALAVSILALAFMSRLDGGASVGTVALCLLAVGAGAGLFQSSNANLVMGSAPSDRLGMGGGVMGLARGLGTVFSVAIMGAAMSARESARALTASEDDAFILAFQDTYRIAAAVGVGALALSIAAIRYSRSR